MVHGDTSLVKRTRMISRSPIILAVTNALSKAIKIVTIILPTNTPDALLRLLKSVDLCSLTRGEVVQLEVWKGLRMLELVFVLRLAVEQILDCALNITAAASEGRDISIELVEAHLV